MRDDSVDSEYFVSSSKMHGTAEDQSIETFISDITGMHGARFGGRETVSLDSSAVPSVNRFGNAGKATAYSDITDSAYQLPSADNEFAVLADVNTQTYDEEETDLETNTQGTKREESLAKDTKFDVESLGKDFVPRVGELSCYCLPTGVVGLKDILYRTYFWTLLNKEQIFSALTVSLTQIPEVISSAFIAGIDPALALQGTWIMNIVTALVGGRPGMISGATSFVAVALMKVVNENGQEYVIPTMLLAGALQIVFGLMGLGFIARLAPHPVVQGFANAAALIVAATQFSYLAVDSRLTLSAEDKHLAEVGHSWASITNRSPEWISGWPLAIFVLHALVAFLISLLLPKITRQVPSALVAILAASVMEWAFFRQIDKSSTSIGEYFKIKPAYFGPIFFNDSIDVPAFHLDTFKKVYLAGFTVFAASVIESLLTFKVVNNLTDSHGSLSRVLPGQGLANIASSLLCGMGGSASVGQSVVANNCDGITGLSSFLTGAFMAIILYVAYPAINAVPIGAIAGVMLWTSFNLVDWSSLHSALAAMLPLKSRDYLGLDCKVARSDTLIMISVMIVTDFFDLTFAVLGGVLIAVLTFAWDSSNRVLVEREVVSEDTSSVVYHISGPLFFGTAQSFVDVFPFEEIQNDPNEVIILLEGAEVFDSSGMFAVKTVYDRFAEAGKTVALSALSATSRALMEKNARMWQGVNFLEIEETVDGQTSKSGSLLLRLQKSISSSAILTEEYS